MKIFSGDKCSNPTKWMPQVLLRVAEEGPTLKANMFGVGVCDLHMESVKVSDFINDESWEKMVEALKAERRPIPKRKLSKLNLIEVPPEAFKRRFYVASRLAGYEKVRHLSNILTEKGHKNTFDWTEYGERIATKDQLKDVTVKEMDGVISSQIVVFLLPGGYGTHVELGLALASGKQIFLVGEQGASYDCSFYYQPNIVRIPDGDPEAIAARILEHI